MVIAIRQDQSGMRCERRSLISHAADSSLNPASRGCGLARGRIWCVDFAMKFVESIAAMKRQSAAWVRSGESVGFVPTMGALHEGHLTLIRRARKECQRVVVSIYVNPTQFGPKEDLAKYPRPREQDLALCRKEG